MEPETFERPRTKKARRRGPAPNTRLTPLEAAYVRLRMAVESLGFADVGALTGASLSHVKNVLRCERGLPSKKRRKVFEALVSPFDTLSPTLSPSQLTWFERLPYLPLLSAGAAATTTAPAAYVSIDKLLLIARLTDRSGLLRHAPFVKPKRGSKSTHFLLSTVDGPKRAIWQRSKADYMHPCKRYLRFHRTVNLNVMVVDQIHTVAKLSIDPFRKRCEAHQGKRVRHFDIPCDCEEHGERCPADHFEYDRPNNFGCSDCAALTETQPNIRFEVTGFGCQLGLHTSLGPSLFAPFVDPETITVAELHLAVDVNAPTGSLLPFQRKLDRNRGFRNVVAHWNEFGDIGLSFGSSSGMWSVAFYNKKAQVWAAWLGERPGAGIKPRHTRHWTDTARIELRVRPPRLGFDPTPQGVLSHDLLDRIATFLVADLRHVQGVTPLSDLACRARQMGFIARSPLSKAATQSKTKGSSNATPADHFGPWLAAQLRKLGMRRKSFEQAVSVLHGTVLDELVRLSIVSGIDLRAIVEESIPRLQSELDACIAIETGSHDETDSWAA
jgi:hypothetical protein